MRRVRCLLLVAVTAGCSSVAWQENGPPDVWHGATLRHGEAAQVAARAEWSAAEVHRRYEAMCEVMRRVGATVPSRPLLLVVDGNAEPLLGDATITLARAPKWHEMIAGTAATRGFALRGSAPPLPGEVLTALARAVAGAVPIDADELALPATWREGVTWCLVVPTQECCDAAADAMLDFGMAEADLSFGQRLLLAPMQPWLRSEARGQMRAQVLRQVLEGAWAAAQREGSAPADAFARALGELGIADDRSSAATVPGR